MEKSEELRFSYPQINNIGDSIEIKIEEATSYHMSPGKPVLPVITQVYHFPLGTTIKNVDVSFSEPIKQIISNKSQNNKNKNTLAILR